MAERQLLMVTMTTEGNYDWMKARNCPILYGTEESWQLTVNVRNQGQVTVKNRRETEIDCYCEEPKVDSD